MHLLRIDDIQHLDKNRNTLWQQGNIDNLLHIGGQFFLLNLAFNTSEEIFVPANYYLGLDNRANIQVDDIFSSLSAEPTQNGYVRQTVNSLNGFSVEHDGSLYRATSGSVTFSASGGSWGPIINLFIGTTSGNSGYLISSATFDTPRTLTDGESITMRISIALKS